MNMTPNFDPTESSPEIFIYDYSGSLQYTYQTSKTQANPTQDFRVTDLTFTIEDNGAYGHATIMIEDNSGNLLDTTLRRKCKIKREWDIQIFMGKDNAGLQRWFYGKIKSATVIRGGTRLQQIRVVCVGWGEMLKTKVTQIKRNQLKASNGEDLDSQDVNTKLYHLILDMFRDKDHYIDNNIAQISTIDIEDAGLITYIDFNKDVKDHKGSGHGTWTGTDTYVNGSEGYAGSFDGSRYVTLDDETLYDFERTDAFSLLFRLKYNAQNNTTILAKRDSTSDVGYSVFLTTGLLNFQLEGSSTECAISVDDTNIDDEEWHHIVITYDGTSLVSGINVYFDGVLQSKNTVTDTLSQTILNSKELTIGAETDGGAKFTGSIDEVKIFNTELTTTEISREFSDSWAICRECLDISLANINELGNSFAGFISNMAGVANTDWWIDYDRKLVVRDANSHDSGFLITNDLEGLDAQGWDSGKIMYLKNEPFAWDDSSFDTMYSWIHGLGHFAPSLDIKEETTPNATDNVDDEWIAIPITPTVDNIFKIAIRLTKTGIPAGNATITIRGDDGTGKPDLNDIRRKIVLTKEKLLALGTSTPSEWLEIPITPKLEIDPDSTLFIVLEKFGDASNTYNVDYKSGSGTYYVSTDDVTWNTATGLPNFRVYSAKRLKTSVEITGMSQKLGEQREKILPIRADLEEQTVRQALIVAAESLGRELRIYDKIICTMPDDRVPLASYLRLQDDLTGLDIKAEIASYTVEMHAGDSQSNIGATQITLTLDDIHGV